MRNLLILTVLSFIVSGCAGYTVSRKEVRLLNPGEFSLKSKGRVGFQESKVSIDLLIDTWGEPDERRTDEGFEYWLYEGRQLIWSRAIGFIVIVPVPMVAPTGRHSVVFKVSGESILEAEVRYESIHMAFCAIYPLVKAPFIAAECVKT